MTSKEIRAKFIAFFEKRGHKAIPSASLVPENDPSVLFNTAGMQPLIPYLLGQKHPSGTRLVNSQKCVRTQDIDEVGDNTHDTFFEMLGNWSLGDYFKEDAIKWSYELLTSKEEGFGLDPRRLFVTVFEGNDDSPKDTEAYAVWEKIFKDAGLDPEKRIFFMNAKANWWSVGDNGPCGPDTEMFYDVTAGGLALDKGGLTKEEFLAADDKQQVVEIWNDVFMQFEKKDGKVVGQLKNQNVDTGSGLERVTMVIQGKDNVFDTDLFSPIMNKIEEFTTVPFLKARRIIADHIRTSVMLIADGVTPSNTDQGYILRRLLRRAVRYSDVLQMKHGSLFWIADAAIDIYKDIYPNTEAQREHIKKEIDQEEQKFRKTLEKGMKEFVSRVSGSSKVFSGADAFLLASSYGFPIEMTKELAAEEGITVDMDAYNEEFKKHQDLSRIGAEQKFKGGLAGNSDVELKYHTATHLLHAALRQVLGSHVSQKGSNITPERLRFDFVHTQKMTDEEKAATEKLVNEWISKDLPVTKAELPFDEAVKSGALHFFNEKYPDVVSVYSIGSNDAGFPSKEFCGGPHVTHTGELGVFKIQKEEAVSAGVRRIKAILS